jgi:signal recognition particle subunit SRP54
VGFLPSDETQKPADIVRGALHTARIRFADVLIVDTAGRLAIDEAMMQEIRQLHALLDPVETLFVVDAMSGQDAAQTARAFDAALPLTGVILSKADADSRGGAALSVRAVTGKPIKFLGVGEKTDALEAFHPERVASRILGMGDILSLIEEAERKLDRDKAEKLAKKLKKGGRGFDLEDFRDQLQQMKSMGGLSAMLDKLPGMAGLAQAAQARIDVRSFSRMEAIINSMTPRERRDPEMLNGSRKRRITEGSGTTIQDLNRLLKQHKQMQKMMKKMGNKGAMQNMMRGLGGMLPPGGGFPGR